MPRVISLAKIASSRFLLTSATLLLLPTMTFAAVADVDSSSAESGSGSSASAITGSSAGSGMNNGSDSDSTYNSGNSSSGSSAGMNSNSSTDSNASTDSSTDSNPGANSNSSSNSNSKSDSDSSKTGSKPGSKTKTSSKPGTAKSAIPAKAAPPPTLKMEKPSLDATAPQAPPANNAPRQSPSGYFMPPDSMNNGASNLMHRGGGAGGAPGYPTENSIPEFGKPLPSAPSGMGNANGGQGWTTGAPSANDEMRVSRLEKAVLGSTYPEHDLDDRVEHLEEETFKSKGTGSMDARLKKMEMSVFGQSAAFSGQPGAPPTVPGGNAGGGYRAPNQAPGNMQNAQNGQGAPYQATPYPPQNSPGGAAYTPPAGGPPAPSAPGYGAPNYGTPYGNAPGGYRPGGAPPQGGYQIPFGAAPMQPGGYPNQPQGSYPNNGGYQHSYPPQSPPINQMPPNSVPGNYPPPNVNYGRPPQQYGQPGSYNYGNPQQPNGYRPTGNQPGQPFRSEQPSGGALLAPPAASSGAPSFSSDVESQRVAAAINSDAQAGDYYAGIRKFQNGTVARWQHFPVLVHLPPNTPELWRRILNDDVKKWSAYVPLKTAADYESFVVDVKWENKLPPSVFGITRVEGSGAGLKVIIFLLRPTFYPSDIPESTLQSVFLHELGHAVGLYGHSTDKADVMYYDEKSAKKGAPAVSVIGQRDLNTLKKVYSAPHIPDAFIIQPPLEYSSH